MPTLLRTAAEDWRRRGEWEKREKVKTEERRNEKWGQLQLEPVH